jgi:N-acetylmuramoyl-L-alanine amidase
MYDRIIVIDSAYGGSDTGIVANDLHEKDIVLNITMRLKELLDETDYKVYYTRLDDNNLSEEKRVRVANNTKADMLIRIQADGDDDSMVNGTTAIYNENFFIPRFGSIELADILEREVVLSIRGKALGLTPATAYDYVIGNATVPAAAIKVGYLTNAQEAILLNRDDYIEKIAVGIFNAIQAVYGN